VRLLLAALLVPLAAASCVFLPEEVPLLGSAQVASDFDSYDLRRVGVMPFQGEGVDLHRSRELQMAFYSEFSRTTPFELVLLTESDLEEVYGSEPHRRGRYHPRTIIETSRRYNLDAILFGAVVREQLFPPQELSSQVDMVAAETGLVIWSASVHLDAGDPRVREGLRIYYGSADPSAESWHLALVSPTRFARFAAYQVASLL
jgi:hypothetical protein